MEAVELTRQDYIDGLASVAEASGDGTYLDKFKASFPQGLNTASSLEICRLLQNPDLEAKIRLARICLLGKPCEVTNPDGSKESFLMSDMGDSFDAFDEFKKWPLALMAVADAIYGYILKKSVRL